MSRYVRTDLAMELQKSVKKSVNGLSFHVEEPQEGIRITRVAVESEEAEAALGKAQGKYVTLEAAEIGTRDPMLEEAMSHLMAQELMRILPEPGRNDAVLVVGLGNEQVTPDALGPRTVEKLMVTRHLLEMMPEAMDKRIRPVCAIAPGVLGETGIETAEVVRGVVDRIHPCAVVAVDALASRDSQRIGAAIQISDAGLQPGSGVGNRRMELNRETLGCPVIAIGIPTVVCAATIVRDALQQLSGSDEMADEAMEKLGREALPGLVVTPREVDVLVEDAARRLAMGLNLWLQEGLTIEEIETFLH